jgi:hypothetical protein
MRHQEQQSHDDRPDVIRSNPVPVPPPSNDSGSGPDRRDEPRHDRAHGDPGPEDLLDERGSYDDRTLELHSVPGADRDRAEFHEPAPQPTTFGAGTVGGAVAASAMASGNPADERDPRADDTVRPEDGAIDDRVDERPNEPPASGARL